MVSNKKGQIEIPVAVFIFLIVGLVILAPFCLKIMRAILQPMGNSLADISPMANISAQHVVTTVTNFWDFGIMFAFLIITIMMFVSAYFIDVHPLFIIFYIILGFIMFLTITPMQDLFTNMYDASLVPDMTGEINALPMTHFLASYFWAICLVLFVISGIIMYGKLRQRSVW